MKMTGIVATLLLTIFLFTPGHGQCDELSESLFPPQGRHAVGVHRHFDPGPNPKISHYQSGPPGSERRQSDAAQWELGGSTFFELMKQDGAGVYRYAERVSGTCTANPGNPDRMPC